MRNPSRFLSAFFICVVISPLVEAQSLFSLINQNMSYMKDVAVYKAKENLPIEDKTAEQAVLDRVQAQAKKNGLDSASVAAFWAAQISVANNIQTLYQQQLDLEQDQVHFAQPDMDAEIQTALDSLQQQIIAAFPAFIDRYQSVDKAQRLEFYQAMSTEYLSEADKKQLYDALLKVRLAD